MCEMFFNVILNMLHVKINLEKENVACIDKFKFCDVIIKYFNIFSAKFKDIKISLPIM